MELVDKINRSGDLVTKLYKDGSRVQKIYRNGDLIFQNVTNEIESQNDSMRFTLINSSAGTMCCCLPYYPSTGQPLTDLNLEYSFDNENWVEWDYVNNQEIDFNEKIYLRGNNTEHFCTENSYITIYFKQYVNISGNIMALIDYTNPPTTIPNEFCFNHLFSFGKQNFRWIGQETEAYTPVDNKIVNAYIKLPATTLKSNCYYKMFDGNKVIRTAPELPSTALTSYCYSGMFSGCTSLETAPELPAAVLPQGCYYGMFQGCTSLNKAPSKISATTLNNSCCMYMFSGCTSLETAPDLTAISLVENCYRYMFYGCSSLNYIKCLAKWGISTNYSTLDWLVGTAETGTFVKDPNTSWGYSANQVPQGWTIIDSE